MKQINTKEAVGQVLCHDITQIIRGVTKAPVFRKGHIIQKEDIPILLSVGKDHVYIWENNENMLHENEAAMILRDICMGDNIRSGEPKEGKIELIAMCDGVFTVEKDQVRAINSLGEMMIAARHGGFAVQKGDILAGTRVIPLVIEKKKMEMAKQVGGMKPLFNVIPFKQKNLELLRREMKFFMAGSKIRLRQLFKKN